LRIVMWLPRKSHSLRFWTGPRDTFQFVFTALCEIDA
jgi:hypothetical protein